MDQVFASRLEAVGELVEHARTQGTVVLPIRLPKGAYSGGYGFDSFLAPTIRVGADVLACSRVDAIGVLG